MSAAKAQGNEFIILFFENQIRGRNIPLLGLNFRHKNQNNEAAIGLSCCLFDFNVHEFFNGKAKGK